MDVGGIEEEREGKKKEKKKEEEEEEEDAFLSLVCQYACPISTTSCTYICTTCSCILLLRVSEKKAKNN